ncbi:transketolase [Oceanivirga salmonicida]|uniref:transketolase n=1 Tax=Oceanivirga salmonicida TaxID=1769291 RepID=UPI00083655A6|nr:1-deoxy-D-xylulose-5-phosphate synthase N-terminal domain-containing protein [Oceanivirga salmonicida]
MKKNYDEIKRIANYTRQLVLGLTIEKNGCYLSQALSSADIFASLYNNIMNITESKGKMIPDPIKGLPGDFETYHTGEIYNGEIGSDYDRLFISPSHYAATVYASLVSSNRMSKEALKQFNTDGSTVEMIGAEHSPGFGLTTGSFGQCISQAAGIAYARKLKKEKGKVYVFLSDGELQEGQTWEAMQAIAFHKIDNLVVYVDVNGQQVDGATKDVMNIEPINKRFEAFGAKVLIVDGHNIKDLCEASKKEEKGKSLVVLCYTNPCEGLPLLKEKKPKLHYVRFTEKEMPKYVEVYKNMNFGRE